VSAGIELHAVVVERQNDAVGARFERNAHVELAAVRRTVPDNVGDHLFEYQLGAVTGSGVESFRIQLAAQTREPLREAVVRAGKMDRDWVGVHRASCSRERRQPRAAAAAVSASARTGTMSFTDVMSRT
jgi:hypothetical protein